MQTLFNAILTSVPLSDYRWFPEGKIVFVAPTKPLVAQQIIASHETCGIPGSDAMELTGQVQSATRSRYVSSGPFLTRPNHLLLLTSGKKSEYST